MTRTEPLLNLPPEQDPFPGWGQSLSAGAAGITLRHVALAQAGVGDWDIAHRWAAAMTRTPVPAHRSASLFCGAPAVAFVLRTARRSAYAAALDTLEGHIATITRHRLGQAHERRERGGLPELREFDLINGLTGIGVCLLQAGNTDLLHDVLSYLTHLAEPVTVDGRKLPGWWTGNGPGDQPSRDWPGGHANLGLAHGITGPLTLMALSMRHGDHSHRPSPGDHADLLLAGRLVPR